VGSSFYEIKKLNPALLRFCTPPDRDKWVLNIPKGSREKFLKEYAKVPDNKKMTWTRHRIRSGETLSTIARKYGVNIAEIKRFNRIRGSLIRAGHSLIIPVPQNKRYAAQVRRRTPVYRSAPRRKPVANVPGRNKKVHVVQQGESLWEIAVNYGVTVTQLRVWNGLGYSRIIKPGQELNVWLSKESPMLAAKEKIEIEGPALPEKENQGDSQKITYTVRAGDTLWDIASQFGVSIHEIKKWNSRRSNLIKPGDKLDIVLPE
jgi:membrane-bound lytic murein transglycosylase D